jgi:hypothetical protein
LVVCNDLYKSVCIYCYYKCLQFVGWLDDAIYAGGLVGWLNAGNGGYVGWLDAGGGGYVGWLDAGGGGYVGWLNAGGGGFAGGLVVFPFANGVDDEESVLSIRS